MADAPIVKDEASRRELITVTYLDGRTETFLCKSSMAGLGWLEMKLVKGPNQLFINADQIQFFISEDKDAEDNPNTEG